MLRKTLLLAFAAILAALATSSRAQAWGAYRHAGYTHYSPSTGLHHYGYTEAYHGGSGGSGGYHYGGSGGYGGYHYGGGSGSGGYHYGGYHYGSYGSGGGGAYGGAHYGYYRGW